MPERREESNIRWQRRRRRRGTAGWRSQSSSLPLSLTERWLRLQEYGAADRQLHPNDDGHRIRDRPRHGSSAVRSVLHNRLTRTPGARERLSFFQSDCHSIRTHLSRRVCADRPPWGRILKAPPGSVFFIRFGFAATTVGYALLIPGKHTKDPIGPLPRPAIFWSVAIVIIAVCALTSAVTAGHDLMPRLLEVTAFCPWDIMQMEWSH